MNIQERSALMIRSLLRQAHLSDHIVWPVAEAPAIKSSNLLDELDKLATVQPVALLHKNQDHRQEIVPFNHGAGSLTAGDRANGWTEVPLYAHPPEAVEHEGPKVGDGTGDAAIAIGEHAFRAGYEACRNDVAHSKQVVSYPGEYDKHLEAAWGAYDPPEHIKDLS